MIYEQPPEFFAEFQFGVFLTITNSGDGYECHFSIDFLEGASALLGVFGL